LTTARAAASWSAGAGDPEGAAEAEGSWLACSSDGAADGAVLGTALAAPAGPLDDLGG
jgi:hypothetical protein